MAVIIGLKCVKICPSSLSYSVWLNLTLCLLGNLACFCLLLIFLKISFFEKFIREYHHLVSNNLDPDQVWQNGFQCRIVLEKGILQGTTVCLVSTILSTIWRPGSFQTVSWSRGYKTFSMLNPAEHDIYPAHNVKMPTIASFAHNFVSGMQCFYFS